VLTRESLIKESALKTEVIKFESGEAVVRELGADEYLDALDSPFAKTDGKYDGPKFTALMVVRCLYDKKGKRLFTDEDGEQLRKGSFALYRKIVAVVNRVNGLDGDVKN
jgi:hypothetical protein